MAQLGAQGAPQVSLSQPSLPPPPPEQSYIDDRAGPPHPPADRDGPIPQVAAAKAGYPLEHPAESENQAPTHPAHAHQTFLPLHATPHIAQAAVQRRRLDTLPQSDNLHSVDPLPQVDQAALPQADRLVDEFLPKEV